MMNKQNNFPQKSDLFVAPAEHVKQPLKPLPSAGSFNSHAPSQNEIVLNCAKFWNWLKPSYRKTALIIVGMDATLSKGQPVAFPNANVFMDAHWSRLPVEWQEKLKRYFQDGH